MKMTFRWFGSEHDKVTLKQIKQIPGMTGVMGLLERPAGIEWHEEEIADYVRQINQEGLQCEVIESVNIHEDIKLGLSSRDNHINNYINTIRNLAKNGVKVIVYNFMPVFDWLRTDLHRIIPQDGSNSLYFDENDLGVMGPLEIVRATAENANGFTLPGWEPERLADLESILAQYNDVTNDMLLENYRYFLNAVMPTCDECNVMLACHPDDPAWPIFGLPRIAHSLEGFDKVIALHPSSNHRLCLCTGSLGSDLNNDIPLIIRHFGEMNRIACMHVRNVKHLGFHHFREASHLSSDGDLDMYAIMKAIYDTCPDVYIRPDHGRMIWDEQGRPGYGLYDRALGAAYLNGLWEAIDKGAKHI